MPTIGSRNHSIASRKFAAGHFDLRVDSRGGPITPFFVDAETPSGAINSANQTFTLSHPPNPPASLQLVLNGVMQSPSVDYNLSGATITYVGTPQTGDSHRAWYRY